MRRVAAGVIAALGAATPAAAESLVLSVSTDQVAITSNFTGTNVTLFAVINGELEGPAADYDLVAVMRGPPASVVARRKDQVFGIWINRAAVAFASAPEFYAVELTRLLSDIADVETLAVAGVGLAGIEPTPEPNTTIPDALVADFRDAFLRLKRNDGFYSEVPSGVDRPGAGIFRASFDLPANVPVGDYTVAAYLFRDGEVVAQAGQPLSISKAGGEQFIFNAAHNASWPYAIAVVLMAMGIGWLGNVVFRRD